MARLKAHATKHLKFSIPFNGDLAFLEESLERWPVYEVHFSGPARAGSSDAVTGNGPGCSLKTFRAVVALCRRHRVQTNLLCNAFSLHLGDLAGLLHLIAATPGIDSLTIADPLAIPMLRERFPLKKLQASVVMNIDTYRKARQILDLGVRVINVPPTLARNGPVLESLGRLRRSYPEAEIKLLVNDVCRRDCALMPWHYLLLTLDSFGVPLGQRDRTRELFGPMGCLHLCRSVEEFLCGVPFIRPEDTAFYAARGYADVFKIVHREMTSEKLRRILAAYFSGSHSGDLFDIMPQALGHLGEIALSNQAFPPGFADAVTNCDRRCEQCAYVRKLARRLRSEGSNSGRDPRPPSGD